MAAPTPILEATGSTDPAPRIGRTLFQEAKIASTWPFHFPKLPEINDRIPFIWRQFVDPCDAPLTVWLQCIGPALFRAVISWFAVDLLQIVRTMFTPPTYGWRLRGQGHRSGLNKSRSRSFRSRAGEIIGFDPNAWVGQELSPFADEEMVMLLPGEVWFWTAADVAVLAAFYYSVLDIGSGFLYEWTSAVAQTKYCQARDDAVLLANAPGYPLLGIFGWDAVGILDASKMRNIAFFNGFGVAQDVDVGVVGCSFGFKNTGGGIGEPWIEARMTCLNGPRAGSYAERRLATGAGISGNQGVTYDMSPGEIWIGEIRVNGSFDIIDPVLWCQARGFVP
jgi:hypothetical protein